MTAALAKPEVAIGDDTRNRFFGESDRAFGEPQTVRDHGEFGRELLRIGHGRHDAKAAPRSTERSRATLRR